MHVYFMGICGTAMGNAALLMRSLGHEVSGSDKGIYPPMSDLLKNAGVKIYDGWSAERLALVHPDLVVVGNVVSRGHPEMEWLLDTRAFDYVSLPELLRTRLLKKRRNIVVAGTHGKTICPAARRRERTAARSSSKATNTTRRFSTSEANSSSICRKFSC